jgi:hypothetical protein
MTIPSSSRRSVVEVVTRGERRRRWFEEDRAVFWLRRWRLVPLRRMLLAVLASARGSFMRDARPCCCGRRRVAADQD